MPSEPGARGCRQQEIILVTTFEPQQDVDLFMCLQIFLPVHQYADVVQTRSLIVRCEFQGSFEEHLRFIEHVALVLDSAQEAQGLKMVAGLESIFSQDLFRSRQLSVREQASSLHYLGWQAF